MSYQLRNNESVPDGVRRIVWEEIGASTRNLKARRGKARDEAVHEVRKSVKKIRGLLRLIKPALGQAYVRENEAWREIGHRLSALRDAVAIIEVFDAVRVMYPEVPAAAIRRHLVANKRATESSELVSRALSGVGSELKRAEGRVKRWPLKNDGFEAIAPGLKRTYRQGAKALQLARKDPAPENMHELRKKVKAHLYQVRLLEGLWDEKLRRHEKRVSTMEEMLGEHHNLHVLKTKIVGLPEAAAFVVFLDKVSGELAKQSISLGLRAYGPSSGRVTDRLEKLWRKWSA